MQRVIGSRGWCSPGWWASRSQPGCQYEWGINSRDHLADSGTGPVQRRLFSDRTDCAEIRYGVGFGAGSIGRRRCRACRHGHCEQSVRAGRIVPVRVQRSAMAVRAGALGRVDRVFVRVAGLHHHHVARLSAVWRAIHLAQVDWHHRGHAWRVSGGCGAMTARLELAFAAVVFLAGGMLLFVTAPHHGEFWWSDAPRHALNGAFVKDMIAAMPAHPATWAMQYYVKYPALTILFYPPLFYLILAPFYALFGVSHATALGVELLHYFALSFGLYMLVRRWVGPLTAIAVGLSAMAAPGIALWGRQVMLEVPSVAFAVWSAVLLEEHLASGRLSRLYLAAF